MKEVFTEEECIQVVQRLYSEIVKEVNNDMNGYYAMLYMLFLAGGATDMGDFDPSRLKEKMTLEQILQEMPCVVLESSRDNRYRVFWNDMYSEWHESAVDACVELLERVGKEEEK